MLHLMALLFSDVAEKQQVLVDFSGTSVALSSSLTDLQVSAGCWTVIVSLGVFCDFFCGTL